MWFVSFQEAIFYRQNTTFKMASSRRRRRRSHHHWAIPKSCLVTKQKQSLVVFPSYCVHTKQARAISSQEKETRQTLCYDVWVYKWFEKLWKMRLGEWARQRGGCVLVGIIWLIFPHIWLEENLRNTRKKERGDFLMNVPRGDGGGRRRRAHGTSLAKVVTCHNSNGRERRSFAYRVFLNVVNVMPSATRGPLESNSCLLLVRPSRDQGLYVVCDRRSLSLATAARNINLSITFWFSFLSSPPTHLLL